MKKPFGLIHKRRAGHRASIRGEIHGSIDQKVQRLECTTKKYIPAFLRLDCGSKSSDQQNREISPYKIPDTPRRGLLIVIESKVL